MNQNAITMTADNSRNRKQANHPGPVCILICICVRHPTRKGRWTGGKQEEEEEKEEAPTERWEGTRQEGGWGRLAPLERVKFPPPGCTLLSLALSRPIKPATPQQ